MFDLDANTEGTTLILPESSVKRVQRMIASAKHHSSFPKVQSVLEKEFGFFMLGKINIDNNFWLSVDMEEKIINSIQAEISLYDELFAAGKDDVLREAFSLLPSDDSQINILEFFIRLPILFQSKVRYLISVMETSESPERIEFRISPLEGRTVKWYDLNYFHGMVAGVMALFQLKDWNIGAKETSINYCPNQFPQNLTSSKKGIETRFEVFWKESNILLGKTYLKPDSEITNTPSFVMSKTGDESDNFTYIDLGAMVEKSQKLYYENRDLEAAVEVLNNFRNELMVKQKAISKDLRMARNIQRGIIPQSIPDWKGLQFAFHFQPMQEVSGDYYDYFNFGSNKIGLMLSDVSGHGVPAAFITAISKLLFTNYKLDSPAEIFSNINREMLELVKQQGYITCFYAVINSEYEVVYSLAGHPRPMLYRSATDEVIQLEGEGTFLGMFEDASQHIKDYRFKLYPGDKLFVYTDGFLEGISDEGEPFQLEDLADLIKKYGQLDTKQCLQKVIQEYHNFCMGTDQSDDVTLIAMGLSPKLKEFEEYKSLGEKLYAEGKVGKACELLIKAKEIFPTDMSVLYLLGKYSAKLKDYKSAIEHLEEYNSFKTFNADSHMILGYSYFNLEDYNKAEREFLKSISLRAGNVTSYLYLAKLFFKKKEYDKSRETLNKLLEIEPDHHKALVMMKHLRKLQKS